MEIRRLPLNQFLYLKKVSPAKAHYLSLCLGSRTAAKNRTEKAHRKYSHLISNITTDIFTVDDFINANPDLFDCRKKYTDLLGSMVFSKFLTSVSRGVYKK